MRNHFLFSINRNESAITVIINCKIVINTMSELTQECIISLE